MYSCKRSSYYILLNYIIFIRVISCHDGYYYCRVPYFIFKYISAWHNNWTRRANRKRKTLSAVRSVCFSRHPAAPLTGLIIWPDYKSHGECWGGCTHHRGHHPHHRSSGTTLSSCGGVSSIYIGVSDGDWVAESGFVVYTAHAMRFHSPPTPIRPA